MMLVILLFSKGTEDHVVGSETRVRSINLPFPSFSTSQVRRDSFLRGFIYGMIHIYIYNVRHMFESLNVDILHNKFKSSN